MSNKILIFLYVCAAICGAPSLLDCDLAIIPTLISAAGGIFGSILSSRSQSATNDAQVRLQQQANAFNHQERLETQEWNRQQWLDANSYNAPLQQAERLRAAGLNPSLMLDGSSAQGLQSAPTSSPASSASSPSLSPTITQDMFSRPLTDMVNVLNGLEQFRAARMDNETRLAKNIADLEKTIEEKQSIVQSKEKTFAERRLAEQQLDTAKVEYEMLKFQQQRQTVAAYQQDTQFERAMAAMSDAHNESILRQQSLKLANDIQYLTGLKMAEKQLAVLDVQLSKARAEIGLISSQVGINQQQVQNLIEDKSKIIAERLGIEESNKQFKETRGLIAQQLKNSVAVGNLAAAQARDHTKARGNRLFRALDNTAMTVTGYGGNLLGGFSGLLK